MTAQVIDLLLARQGLKHRGFKFRMRRAPNTPKPKTTPRPKGAKVLFVGGPMDGEIRFLRPLATRYEFRFRPPNLPHVNAFYEVAVETQDGGEFHFVGFEYPEDTKVQK